MANIPPVKTKVYENMIFFLQGNQEGIRANELGSKIKKKLEDEKFPRKLHLHGIVANLSILTGEHPDEFAKSKEKGSGVTYFWIGDNGENSPAGGAARLTVKFTKVKERIEDDFYPSFAEYLEYRKNENNAENRLDECTKAVSWGGNRSGGIWGTPDVVGVFKPKRKANVQFSHEIITAEIKISETKNALIIAFGQACAYRLFSHKTYLAVPNLGESARLESLCHIFGIGLVYFNPKADKLTPDIYQMKLRAQKHSPDMYYVNEFIVGELADALYD